MYCTNCGNEVNDKDKFCSTCGTGTRHNSNKKKSLNEGPEFSINFIRWMAVIVDVWLILILWFFVFDFILIYLLGFFPTEIEAFQLLFLSIFPALYFSCFEASQLRATPAKLLLRLKVVGANGGPAPWHLAMLRGLWKTVPVFNFISFLFIHIRVDGRALHDVLTVTKVAKKTTD